MQTLKRHYEYFQPQSYQLELSLEREDRVFHGTVVIAGEKMYDDQPVILHAKELHIASVVVDDTSVAFTHENDELTITPTLSAGTYTMTIIFDGKITDGMHGLYPCYYEHEGVKKELLVTQFESHYAREVFPCVDEPEAKATFDLTLITEPDVTVLSNMPEEEGRRKKEEGRKTTTFQTTPRMSTYLLAFVVGELHKKTATTKSGVEVNVWSTLAHPPETLDFALDFGVRTIDFFDEYFETPYPLPKVDHVGLPDFATGAMENWGLITYREALLAVTPNASIVDKQFTASIIAHEVSHQWFGNLVTMQWWDNLWLNESFARLMEYVALDALEPSWRVWDDYTSRIAFTSLRRGALEGIQPVQAEVRHPDEISTLFDLAIVYGKGSHLLRMLRAYVGEEAFRDGLRLYFSRHAYGNTTENDLWRALNETSGIDVVSFMQAWISQPGYPLVTISENALEQERFFIGPHKQDTTLWPIPLFSNNPAFPKIFDSQRSEITPGTQAILNTSDVAPFVTRYSAAQLERIAANIHSGTLPPVERLRLLHEQSLLVQGNYTSAVSLLTLLTSFVDETEEPVWATITRVCREVKPFVIDNDEAKAALGQFTAALAEKQYTRLGWTAQHDEPESDTKLRPTILGMMLHSKNTDATRIALEIFDTHDIDEIDLNIRSLVLRTVMRERPDDTALFEKFIRDYAASHSPELRRDLMAALIDTPSQANIAHLLSCFTDKTIIRPQDIRRWFVLLIHTEHGRTPAWHWLRENWSWIKTTFAGDITYDHFPEYAANYLLTSNELDEYIAFFEPLRDIPVLTRAIDLGIHELEGRVRLLEEQSHAVQQALIERTTHAHI